MRCRTSLRMVRARVRQGRQGAGDGSQPRSRCDSAALHAPRVQRTRVPWPASHWLKPSARAARRSLRTSCSAAQRTPAAQRSASGGASLSAVTKRNSSSAAVISTYLRQTRFDSHTSAAARHGCAQDTARHGTARARTRTHAHGTAQHGHGTATHAHVRPRTRTHARARHARARMRTHGTAGMGTQGHARHMHGTARHEHARHGTARAQAPAQRVRRSCAGGGGSGRKRTPVL